MKKYMLAIAALVAFSASAEAKDWQVDYAQSKLGFVGDQSGEKFNGAFKKFEAQISLDPDHPEAGKIAVTVNLASAVTGDDERDSYLPQDSWFNVAHFPSAHFNATSIRKTGANAYEADGTLEIKGVTKNVALPFTLVPEGDHWRAQGHVTLMRTDFSLGTGSFASENYVKHAVDVVIDLVAKPVS